MPSASDPARSQSWESLAWMHAPTAWYSELPIIGHLAHLMAMPQTPSDVRGKVAPGVPAGGVVAVPGRKGRFQSNGKADQILYWMRVEAIVGVSVLLCAALLAPLAGTLAPGPASASGSFGASGGTQTLTQKVDNLTVTLSVNPGKFGTNTFTLVVKNPDGSAASNGTVFLETQYGRNGYGHQRGRSEANDGSWHLHRPGSNRDGWALADPGSHSY